MELTDTPTPAGGATVNPTTTMSAITQDRYGPASHVQFREVDLPVLDDGEVLVRVHAAGVDRGVWHVMTGLPYPIRLAGYGVRKLKNPVLGTDVAGVVEAVGDAVTQFRPGDQVFGSGQGSFAEYVRVREDKLAPKPANLTFEQAAVVPVSALTALQALRDEGAVEAGQKVLIVGASGGVGTYAVQIAKAYGAHVTGVCSTAKVAIVRSTGADQVLDYTQEDFADGRERYDLILDIGGNSPLSRLRRALSPTGTLVIVGGETDGRWLGGNDRQIRAIVMSAFISQDLGTFVASVNADDLAAISRLVEAGKVAPVIDRAYPLHEAAAAIEHVAAGRARGKVVLTVRADDSTRTPR